MENLVGILLVLGFALMYIWGLVGLHRTIENIKKWKRF